MSDVNTIPEGSCPHCSPTPAEEPCCAPAEGSTGCGCRHKQRTEEEYKHLITRLNRIAVSYTHLTLPTILRV